MAAARQRLALAHASREAGFPFGAVSAAYYAMLYAARAALSEEDANAKTHRDTWALFRRLFVDRGRLDAALVTAAQRARELREAADYEAADFSGEAADEVIRLSEEFVAAVAMIIAD
jgi:uncharacterized protein (UPF0332 family)